MKRRALIILLFLFLTAQGIPSYAAAVWAPQVSTSQEVLNAVQFVDARTGWSVGGGGAILATTDRGNNWTTQASGTSQDLNGIYLYDPNNGLAVGTDRTVVEYNGTAWSASQISLTSNLDLTDVYMLDANTVWVSGGTNFFGGPADFRNVFKSTDGGSSWTSSNVRNTGEATTILNYLYAVNFVDANHGWVAGINNDSTPAAKVFRTTDGGTSWSDVSPANADDVILRDIYFTSTLEGWAAGGNAGTSYGYIYHTTNAGASWETELSYSPALIKSLDGATGTNLWASDHTSVFERDSGIWTETQISPTSGYFNGIFVNDAWNIWTVGGQLTAEGGALRYIYKYVVDPTNLAIDKTFYVSSTTYEVDVAFSGEGIQSNATVTIEAAAGLIITTSEVVYEPSRYRYKIDATIRVDPATATAGTYDFTITNPDDASSGTGSLSLQQATPAGGRPTAIPVAEKIFDPATESQVRILVGTPGEVVASSARAFGAITAAAQNVELELLVYRYSNRRIAYRKKFFADPDGYTTITLDKVTDLGLEISEGVYNAVVVHPKYGKIGSGMLVVHYTR